MTILAGLDPLTVTLVILAAYGTAVFHSVSGFAGGLLLTICLAPIVGVKEVVPVVATAMVVSNITRVWVFWRSIDWPVYRAIMTTGFPMIVVGAVIYINLPVQAVAVVLGTFLILTVPLRRYFAKRDIKVGRRSLTLFGVPYGLVSGTTIGAGMMLTPFLLGAQVFGVSLVATVAALGLTLNLTKMVVFGASPVLDATLTVQGLLIGLFTIPGAFTGRWIVSRTPIRVHTVFLEAFILAGAGYFRWTALAGSGAP